MTSFFLNCRPNLLLQSQSRLQISRCTSTATIFACISWSTHHTQKSRRKKVKWIFIRGRFAKLLWVRRWKMRTVTASQYAFTLFIEGPFQCVIWGKETRPEQKTRTNLWDISQWHWKFYQSAMWLRECPNVETDKTDIVAWQLLRKTDSELIYVAAEWNLCYI